MDHPETTRISTNVRTSHTGFPTADLDSSASIAMPDKAPGFQGRE